MSNISTPTLKESFSLTDKLSRISGLDGTSAQFSDQEGHELKEAVGKFYSFCSEVSNSSNFWNLGLSHPPTDSVLSELLENYACEVSDGFSEQLYFYSLNRVPLPTFADLNILEVGCGLGAGLNFLSRVIEGARFTGVDLCETAVQKAKAIYARGNIDFRVGDAENLDFPDGQFDIVLNIESCHNYPHIERFVSNAARVLKPGGHLVVCDFFSEARLDNFRELLTASELRMHAQPPEDISSLVKDAVWSRLDPKSWAMRHFNDAIGTNFVKKLMLKPIYHVAIGADMVDYNSDLLSRGIRKMLRADKRFSTGKYMLQIASKS